ncbi:hypothetical protein C8R48DRAFT_780092 [Suillus tomentosus]|nr:hypothetical protein C8R48DRAFT_780092 [Suillus tomentosus]
MAAIMISASVWVSSVSSYPLSRSSSVSGGRINFHSEEVELLLFSFSIIGVRMSAPPDGCVSVLPISPRAAHHALVGEIRFVGIDSSC